MTKVTDLLSLERLQKEIDKGYVKRSNDETGRLAIISYTNKAQICKDWPDERRWARGLIYDTRTHELIARPLPKFFNYGETHPLPDPSTPVVATDKLDGSLGILFHDHNGVPFVVTRGSFSGPQAAYATRLYRERYHGKWSPQPRTTYLFEIIYPENRIVLDYKGVDDLFGLCAVNIDTGATSYHKDAWNDWPGPRTTTFKHKTLADAVQAAPRANAEGIVVQLLDGSHTMLKIKQEDYKALHKAKGGLTDTTIWEALSKGASVDDVCALCEVDELHDDIRKRATEMVTKVTQRRERVKEQFNMLSKYAGDRKVFAHKVLALQENNSQFLFALRAGKDINESLWHSIKP